MSGEPTSIAFIPIAWGMRTRTSETTAPSGESARADCTSHRVVALDRIPRSEEGRSSITLTAGPPASRRTPIATWSRRVSSNVNPRASTTTTSTPWHRMARSTAHRRSAGESSGGTIIRLETARSVPVHAGDPPDHRSAHKDQIVGRHRRPIHAMAGPGRPWDRRRPLNPWRNEHAGPRAGHQASSTVSLLDPDTSSIRGSGPGRASPSHSCIP